MLIEAVVRPVTCRWPGGSARLIPGRPVEMPDAQAEKLLRKAGNKVRVIQGPVMKAEQPDWAAKWRDLAKKTTGLLPTDARLPLVKGAMDRCDAAYKSDDAGKFDAEVERIQRLMKILPGASIQWETFDRTTQRGLVDFIACDETGRLWVYLTTIQGQQVALNWACAFSVES